LALLERLNLAEEPSLLTGFIEKELASFSSFGFD